MRAPLEERRSAPSSCCRPACWPSPRWRRWPCSSPATDGRGERPRRRVASVVDSPGHARGDQVVRHGQHQGRHAPHAQRGQPVHRAAQPALRQRAPDPYGNNAITYANPPQSFIPAGQQLFAQTCSSCHGNEANGVDPRARPPSARTCRAWRGHRRLLGQHRPDAGRRRQGGRGRAQADPADPAAGARDRRLGQLARPRRAGRPDPHLDGANLSVGADLFSLNCAACHTITGAGDALAYGTNAPTLQNRT